MKKSSNYNFSYLLGDSPEPFKGSCYGESDTMIYEDRIFELRVGANSWNILNITLQNGRGLLPTAIPLF